MAIKYNSNKKTTFNNYIDVAVSNLKKAETEASCLLNFAFPSKTIIGRRFNKKSQIGTLKGNINSAYKSLSTIKSDVQEQVDRYLKANSNAIMMGDSLIFPELLKNKFKPREALKKYLEEYKNASSEKKRAKVAQEIIVILAQKKDWYYYITADGKKYLLIVCLKGFTIY